METLEQLTHYGSEEFELWLDTRLRAQYSQDSDERYRAFDFRALGVPFGESHIDQLNTLYRMLTAEAQSHFRHATQQLFRHAQPGDFPPAAMADLVLIMGLVKAHGALRAFIPVIGSGPWGELRKSLTYDALSVLLMFGGTLEAYDAAKGLATSTHFPAAYVFDAYLVLVRSRPENWAADLGDLRETFFALQQRVGKSGDNVQRERLARRQRDLAVSLVQAVPLFLLGEQLGNLKLRRSGPNEASDQWLVHNLLVETGVRLESSADENSLCLIKGTSQARVSRPQDLWVFYLYYRRSHDDREYRAACGQLSLAAQVRLENCMREPLNVGT